ncbi:uncharacterized protein LOC136082630 [Hydra vulgaris]|uniref:Uncharacterized protein LOC136082630 n=1 Tax=Hydra vulgaris TaxID=6087 RepID=A0ABM4C913_HYDVU
MEYCCYIWVGFSNDTLSLQDKVQKRIVNIVGPGLSAKLKPLSYRRKVESLSLFNEYYHDRRSKELSSLGPSTKTHSRLTRHSSKFHSFTASVPACSKKFYSSSFLPCTSTLWNSLPSLCFLDSLINL